MGWDFIPLTAFGLHFEEYLTQQLHKPILIAQIENIEGVNNIDSIAASAEVDGIFFRSI